MIRLCWSGIGIFKNRVLVIDYPRRHVPLD
jgi:hypothetical protein